MRSMTVASLPCIVRFRRVPKISAILSAVSRHRPNSQLRCRPLLHALEDVVDAVDAFACHAPLPRHDMVLLAHPLLGPFDRQSMIAGEGFPPRLVVVGPLAQDLLADHRNADHLTEEVHDLLRTRETAEVAVNDNAVE